MTDSHPRKAPSTDTMPKDLDYLKLAFVNEHFDGLAREAAQAHWGHANYLASLMHGEALALSVIAINKGAIFKKIEGSTGRRMSEAPASVPA